MTLAAPPYVLGDEPLNGSKAETAAKIEAIVRAADGPVSSAKIAEALGLERNNSSYRRALEYARQQGMVVVHAGRGWEAP